MEKVEFQASTAGVFGERHDTIEAAEKDARLMAAVASRHHSEGIGFAYVKDIKESNGGPHTYGDFTRTVLTIKAVNGIITEVRRG